jgi:hypothetical protein
VWGKQSVHQQDLEAIRSKVDCDDVQAVDPFDLVSLQMDRAALPSHVGRLAPLIGLLASDEAAPETLIDFVNPRQRVEEEPDRLRRLLLVAGPIAAVFLLGFFAYQRVAGWDRKIAAANEEINLLKPAVEAADESIARTEQIDQFLDQDVNWLDELKRFAEKAPPSDKLIVESIAATADSRTGASLRISGAVTDLEVIDQMEASLRDETHSVVGKGTQQQDKSGPYRYTFTETITISNEDLRNIRYARLAETAAASDSASRPDPDGRDDQVSPGKDNAAEGDAEDNQQSVPAEDAPAEEPPAEDASPDTAPSESTPADDAPTDDNAQEIAA